MWAAMPSVNAEKMAEIPMIQMTLTEESLRKHAVEAWRFIRKAYRVFEPFMHEPFSFFNCLCAPEVNWKEEEVQEVMAAARRFAAIFGGEQCDDEYYKLEMERLSRGATSVCLSMDLFVGHFVKPLLEKIAERMGDAEPMYWMTWLKEEAVAQEVEQMHEQGTSCVEVIKWAESRDPKLLGSFLRYYHATR